MNNLRLSQEVTIAPAGTCDITFTPAGTHVSAFWLHALGPCDGLLLTSIAIDNEEQLAVDHAPAALLEQVDAIGLIVLPGVTPHSRVVVCFVNHADAAARFRLWFGPANELRQQAIAEWARS